MFFVLIILIEERSRTGFTHIPTLARIEYFVKKLPIKAKLCYGFGGLGYNSMSQTLGNFIMFFGTSIMGIPGTLVGLAVAISSLWDGISDPLVGYISDNTKNKFFGRRLAYMACGSVAIAIINILIWSMPPNFSAVGKFFWLLLFMLAIETANTFFSTPFSALAIDMAPDYNEQSKIQSYKTVFNIIGMILPSIMLYFFMPSISFGVQTDFSQQGYMHMAYVNSILVLLCGLTAVFGTLKSARKCPNFSSISREKLDFGKLLGGYFEVLKKPNFRAVILGYAMATVSSAFLMSVGMHLFTYCYHFSSAQISIMLIALFGGAIMSQPLWVYSAKRLDKKQSLLIALTVILFGIALAILTFLFRDYALPNTMFWCVLPCIMVCGIGLGAMYSLPMSMYADVVTLEMYKTGSNNAGAYTGYYTFTYNLANSLSLFLIGLLLDFIKFDSTQPIQAMSVQNGLGIIVFCGCAISLALSILIFSKFSIKRADVLKTQLKLKKSR